MPVDGGARTGHSTSMLTRWLEPTSQTFIEQVSTSKTMPRPDPVHYCPPVNNALLESVAAHGILEPLLLMPVGDALPAGGFVVIQGMQRLAAAHLLGISTLPAIARNMDPKAALIAGTWSALARTGATAVVRKEFRVIAASAGFTTKEINTLLASIPQFHITYPTMGSGQLSVDL